VHFWNAEQRPAPEGQGAFRDYRPRSRAHESAPSVVTSGGSVGPFLRKFYRHQVVVSGPVQRIFLFLLLAGVIYAFVLGESGAVRIAVLRHERASLDRSIAELQRNTQLLETETARLDSDPFYIEKTGRERYGYIRPGDRVYKIVPVERESR
jgi:cell division protein FtsB